MGENKKNIFNFGSPGIDMIKNKIPSEKFIFKRNKISSI